MQTNELMPELEIGTGILGDGAVFAPGSEVAYTTFGDLVPTSATITAWILPLSEGEQGEGRIVDVVIPQTELSVTLQITSFAGEPNLAATTITGGTSTLSALTSVPLDLGAWHFVALTVDKALEIQLFVDGEGGEPEPLVSEAGAPLMLIEPTLAIGGPIDGGPQHFDGTIDEVRVRPESLAADEIFGEYMSQLTSAAQLGVEESI